MLSIEPGRGRVIAYGGDTWVWARYRKRPGSPIASSGDKSSSGSRTRERQRQQGQVTLDRRRLAAGKLELSVTTRDAGALDPEHPLQGQGRARRPIPSSSPVDVFNQGDEEGLGAPRRRSAARQLTVTVVAERDGQEIGHDTGGSSSSRTTASWRIPPPTSPWRQIASITDGGRSTRS
jgi:hypothetical protein